MNFEFPSQARCPHSWRPLALGVALAMLSVGAGATSRLRAPDAKRVAQAVSAARDSAGVELVARTSLVNQFGQTIVRASQVVQGHRVWGSEAVVRAEKSGTARIAASSLSAGAAPAGTPRLTQAQAVAIARRAIGLKGRGAPICLRHHVLTSGRRWRKHGVLRTILLMWRLRLAFFFGADPDWLAQRYGYGPRDS